MIIATAGHVDHGKTTLLQAITGINADRLPEEKSRGMTIDLGYAYWPQPDGRVLGFIDVPGHEKFLSNMLAGVGGIDHALLVVACDDGVMAQTREHLAILQLTGNPTLTVALTKTDRVEGARIDDVRREIAQVLDLSPVIVEGCVQHVPQGLPRRAGQGARRFQGRHAVARTLQQLVGLTQFPETLFFIRDPQRPVDLCGRLLSVDVGVLDIRVRLDSDGRQLSRRALAFPLHEPGAANRRESQQRQQHHDQRQPGA